MAEIVRFPNRAEAHEKAAAWLARVDKGMSAEDEVEMRNWLREDKRNREAFFELAALWDEADRLAELAELFPLEEAVPRPARPRVAHRWWYATAAAIGLAGIAVFVMDGASLPTSGQAQQGAAFATEYRTSVGGRVTERLPDESVVELNTDTALSVDYSAAERNIFLERGEAFFDVAHDASRPFNVHVAGRIVEALGTTFNVRLAVDGGIQVMVTDGRVRMMDAAGEAPGSVDRTAGRPEQTPTLLARGELAVVESRRALEYAGPEVQRLDPAEVDAKLAWQRGVLIFRGESLESVLDEVSRYTTTEFVLAEQELASVRVGGYFRAGDIDSLLVALRENLDIESSQAGDDRVVLRFAQ